MQDSILTTVVKDIDGEVTWQSCCLRTGECHNSIVLMEWMVLILYHSQYS